MPWRELGAPTIDVEACRSADVGTPDILRGLETTLSGILLQLERPDHENIEDLLYASVTQVRTLLQQMGGIAWVRCSIGDQGIMVTMEDEDERGGPNPQ